MNPKDTYGPAVTKARERFLALKPAHKTAVVITAVAILWVASGVFKMGGDGEPAIGEAPLPRVRVVVSESQTYTPTISLLGRTEAGQAVNVRAEVTGRVAEIVTAKGSAVTAGQVIVRLDTEDRAQRVAEAEARFTQTDIAYQAARKLAKGGLSSDLNVAQAQANLEAARAAVTRAKRDLDSTSVKAPFAGVVDQVPVEVGDYLDKAGFVVARVLDLSAVKAIAQVTERDVTAVALGEPARMRLPDGRELQGAVTYVGQSTTQATRTFPVEVTADSPGQDVPAGVTAQIVLPLEPIVGHKISRALLTLNDQGRIGVKAVDDQGLVQFHPVRIASDMTDGTWLTGLDARLKIITVGQEFVRVGEKVEPVEGELPSAMAPQASSGATPGAGTEN